MAGENGASAATFDRSIDIRPAKRDGADRGHGDQPVRAEPHARPAMVTTQHGDMHKTPDRSGDTDGAAAPAILGFSFRAHVALLGSASFGLSRRSSFLPLPRPFRALAILLRRWFGQVLIACDRQVGNPVSFTGGGGKPSLIFLQRIPFRALSNSNHKRRFALARPAKEPYEGLPLQGYQLPQHRLQLELEISRCTPCLLISGN